MSQERSRQPDRAAIAGRIQGAAIRLLRARARKADRMGDWRALDEPANVIERAIIARADAGSQR